MSNKLYKNASFIAERNKIRAQVDERLEATNEYQLVQKNIAKLDELRKDGLYEKRRLATEVDRYQADHELNIDHTQKAQKRARQAYIRENKRLISALSFQIKEKKAEINEHIKKEFRREKRALPTVTAKEKLNLDPNSLRQFDDVLPNTIKGLDVLLKLVADQSSNSKDAELVKNYQTEIAQTRSALRSEKDEAVKLQLLKKIDDAESSIALTKELNKMECELVKEYNALKKNKDYFVSLGRVCRKAYAFHVSQDLYRLEAFLKGNKRILKRQAAYDLSVRKAEDKAAIKNMKQDPTYFAELKTLEEALAKAKQVEKANKSASKAIADEAWTALRTLFNKEIGESDANRQEYRKAQLDELKDASENAKIAFRGNKDKMLKVIHEKEDEVYFNLALAAVENDYLKERQDDLARKISASLSTKKEKTDEDIESFYKTEELTNDPSLVDTSSMRLVIKNIPTATDVKAIERRDKVSHGVSLFFIYLFLVFFAVLVLFPFYWMINTSLKSTEEIVNSITPTLWPENVMWSNYVDVFDRFDFFTYLANTLVVGIFSTIGVLLTCILSAFAFARLKFKGRDTLFMVFLATMMIPGEMMVITNYITVANFGWIGANAGRINAYLAMILPFCVSVFYIYLLRQNFKQIPEELYLAAKVDGKSDWSFLWRVMVPLCRPTLITIGILELMGSWNAYVWPNLVATRQEYRLISNGLRSTFTTSSGIQEYGLQMAATVYVTLPLLLLFIFFRKYIMKGVGRAGIKG